MSQTVRTSGRRPRADRVRQIFGLIGDSLNPIADAVRRSKIEWIGVRHEEGRGAGRGRPGQAHRPAAYAPYHWPGSNHLVAGSMKRAATRTSAGAVRRHAAQSSTALISSRPPSPICCFATPRSTPKPFPPGTGAGVIHQAIAAAYAGPGVAHLTLPQDVIAAGRRHSPSLATLKAAQRILRQRERRRRDRAADRERRSV